MCLFTHFAAGALAGGVTGNVYVGAVAGLASHAVLDAIPHYDHPDWRLELAGGVDKASGFVRVGRQEIADRVDPGHAALAPLVDLDPRAVHLDTELLETEPVGDRLAACCEIAESSRHGRAAEHTGLIISVEKAMASSPDSANT